MANLIIKSSADDLVLKGSGQTGSNAAITVAATGTTTFAENATLSGTANALGTVTSGNLSNTAILHPSGHVVKKSFTGLESQASHIVLGNVSYVDSGLELSHQTRLSSADSYLMFEFWTGMAYIADSAASLIVDTTMRTVSNSTYTVGESITTSPYPTYNYAVASSRYFNLYMKSFCGLVSGMGMPATKSTWAAGDTLYFRVFAKRSSGNAYLVHQNSPYNLTITEVVR